jgi:hypothetical protein
MRFERASAPITGTKLFRRNEVNPRLAFEAAIDRGAFLAALWVHFGPPRPSDAGFEYQLCDCETGLSFTAYVDASGPSYGGSPAQRKALRPVLEAFEDQLFAGELVDCAISYAGGTRVLGYRAGRSFDIAERRNRTVPPVDRRRSA